VDLRNRERGGVSGKRGSGKAFRGRGRPSAPRPRRPIDFLPLIGTAILIVAIIAIPIDVFEDSYSLVMTDRNGGLLGALLAEDETWRFPPMGPVPEKFKKALILFEDKRFYSHQGIDPFALARAFGQDIASRSIASGGSTITMQAARLGLGPSRRTALRKILEMAIAVKLESFRSKEWILRAFASQAPFGGNVVGLEAASWRYFGRSPSELSWAESATLAVLPNAPSLMRLDRNRGLLIAKRDRLLKRMEKARIIDEPTLRLSLAEDLPPAPYPLPRAAPHLLASAKAGVFGPLAGHVLGTSLDPEIQARASGIVADHLRILNDNGVRNAALIIAENDGGKVIAYVGNAPDPEGVRGGYVDVIQEPRSTGSLLKPFLYAAMLSDGVLLPERIVPDIPTKFPGFAPENASRNFRGAVPAYMALARSLNVPAIRLLREYGLDRFYADLKALGMTTLFRDAADYGLPLVIGGAEGKLWELAGMYSGLARSASGNRAPYFPLSILADSGPPAEGKDLFSPGAAYLAMDALLKVLRPGAGENWEEFSSSKKIAWKTGTSQGNKDAWAIGMTPWFTVGVWAGNADGEARPELGGSVAAAPMLFAAFDALPDAGWFKKPDGFLETVEICAASGYPPGPNCGERKTTEVPIEAHRGDPCPYCVTAHLDAGKRRRTNAVAEGGAPIVNEPWFTLPPAMEWYYRMGNVDYRPLPPYKEGVAPDEGDIPIGVIYPQDRSEIYIPRELSGERGRFVAEAVHRNARARIFWHLDAQYLGSTADPHTMGIIAAPGEHVLTLVDETGATIERKFTILEAK
jgi:penicillin-binding protein 1C